MPELPEVETIARSLAPRLEGRRIVEAAFPMPRVVRGDPAALTERLSGVRIVRVGRRAKFLLLELDRGTLSIHLGMTGRLLADAEPGPHTRAVLTLDDGRLLYDDIRMFGRIEWSEGLPARVSRLGPDALGVGCGEFASLLGRRRGRIKPLLLNQVFLGGLGNIYADEALFRARIHPLAPVRRIGAARARRLHGVIVDLLGEAVRLRGSSISNYVDGEGRPGDFQSLHRVYGRAGEPCTVCGTAVRRIVAAGRGTHYCPCCQRP